MKTIIVFLSATLLLTSCSSTTIIQSNPSGAEVYIDREKKGTTPYSYSDTKIVGAATAITLKKEGYQDFNVTLKRNERADVGAIVGGCFLLVPFLWTMQYNPTHDYELEPASTQNTMKNSNENSNAANELILLRNLLDQKLITNDDYTTLKVKILNNQYNYNNSVSNQILKLKELLDSKLLTKEEYLSQKNKLVNNQ